MADPLSTRNMVKFNGTNFQVWKFQINAVLVASGIDDVVK